MRCTASCRDLSVRKQTITEFIGSTPRATICQAVVVRSAQDKVKRHSKSLIHNARRPVAADRHQCRFTTSIRGKTTLEPRPLLHWCDCGHTKTGNDVCRASLRATHGKAHLMRVDLLQRTPQQAGNTVPEVRFSQIFVIALTVQGVLRVHYGSPPDGDFTLRRSIVSDEKVMV